MKIVLDTTPEVEIEIKEGATEEVVAEQLSKLDAVRAIAKKVGGDTYFAEFPNESDGIADSYAKQIADIVFSGSEDVSSDLMQFITENGWNQNPEDVYDNDRIGEKLRDALSEVVDSVTDKLNDLDANEISDKLIKLLEETVIGAMYEEDASKPEDMIPGHTLVEVSFIPDTHLIGWDDAYVQHYDVSFDVSTAIPDASFMRALKFFNISLVDFMKEAEGRGFNLANPVFEDGVSEYVRERIEANALHWRAALEVADDASSNENIRKLPLRSKHEIADWNEAVSLIKTGKDFDRPAALSMDNLFTVLDNASYGGAPTYVARLPLKDILAGKFNTPFEAKGGFIGIHDFMNGSGYIEVPDAPVLIDPSKGRFHSLSVDSVYGIVESYYRAQITTVEVPSYQRIKENVWYKVAEDGRQIEVTKSVGSDGVDEYWVQSLDEGGSPAGPRATHEVFTSLGDAQSEGDDLLAAVWAEKAPTV